MVTALAVAYASAGKFDEAIAAVDEALARLEGSDANNDVVEALRRMRKRYQGREPPLAEAHYRHLIVGP